MELESITQLLKAHASGDREALDRLIALIYEEMRRMASIHLRGERSDHFFEIAAQVMRNILVDYAVRQQAMKRGGKRIRVEVNDFDALVEKDQTGNLNRTKRITFRLKIDRRPWDILHCIYSGSRRTHNLYVEWIFFHDP
jgi:hypothetical protein